MENEIAKIPVLQLTREGEERIELAVACEFPLTIILNGEELVTLLCTPSDMEYLAVGFLASEGFISSRDDIKKTTIDQRRGVVRLETVAGKGRNPGRDVLFKRIITSGCGRGASFYSAADATSRRVESEMEIAAGEVFALTQEFQRNSRVHLATHGVHSAALCDRKNILVFSEDIGRHNAIDKIFGQCLLEGIPTKDRLIVTSGRMTSEILHKVAKRDIPIVISISSATNQRVQIADKLGITLIGGAKGKKMYIYTNGERVVEPTPEIKIVAPSVPGA